MYTDYLKATLQRIAELNVDAAGIRSRYKDDNGNPDYPWQCGALYALASRASIEAESALKWTVDHVESAEREGARLVSILEALGIDLDEETLATLELIGKRDGGDSYTEYRRDISRAVNKAVASAQSDERDMEHDAATEALLAAGFVHDEDADCFNRDSGRVTITLVNGRESRYEWEYGLTRFEGKDGALVDSGKSGEFSRLLALIVPKVAEVVQ